MKKTILLLIIVMLFTGCIQMDYKEKQTFNADGTSTLIGDESTVLNITSSLGALGTDSGDKESTVTLKLIEDYYKSDWYGKFSCSLIVNNKNVEKCDSNANGGISVTSKLTPGDFYKFEEVTDLVNLRETRTYIIDQVPMSLYYASVSSDDYKKKSSEDINNYVKENLDKYIDEDYYCKAVYPFNCDVVSLDNDQIVADISPQKYVDGVSLKWIACTDKDTDEFLFAEEDAVLTDLEDVVKLDKTLASNSDVTISVQCPANAKTRTLVIGYITKSSFSSSSETTIGTMEVKTKEEMKASLIESLDKDNSLGGTNSLGSTGASTKPEDYMINFKKGTLVGSEFEKLQAASVYGVTVKMDYTAEFPGKVVSATYGTENLKTDGNDVKLTMKELSEYGKGELKVVVEKELSPLGVYTWAIPILLVLILLYLAIFRKPTTTA